MQFAAGAAIFVSSSCPANRFVSAGDFRNSLRDSGYLALYRVRAGLGRNRKPTVPRAALSVSPAVSPISRAVLKPRGTNHSASPNASSMMVCCAVYG
ncbi:hypothetical protein GQ607_007266 [Colletotrichum asianum]|uniref:Uncharacterized protein n=1 Tax=Colletotrichum asianum TaxID=702518 RepID=A0A8H3WFR8_9PEZI|nr:hypothetical protein GQ607_007266 [Colletotrichum asianum]